jgi:hypothetical protein
MLFPERESTKEYPQGGKTLRGNAQHSQRISNQVNLCEYQQGVI